MNASQRKKLEKKPTDELKLMVALGCDSGTVREILDILWKRGFGDESSQIQEIGGGVSG